MVLDKDFSSQWISRELVPLLRDEQKLVEMGQKAHSVGIVDGTSRMVNLIDAALSSA
jgi:UDP-N-acetylglucosamine--N-acetylmuramyl-(pentapeptide) pyrophosphoryl-undecaprenol N-acetylglucosamine transferase